MELKDYLRDFMEAQGIYRLVIMSQIRDYMTRIGVEEALKEVATIQDEKQLNVLIGIGLKGVLYHKVIGLKARLEGLI